MDGIVYRKLVEERATILTDICSKIELKQSNHTFFNAYQKRIRDINRQLRLLRLLKRHC